MNLLIIMILIVAITIFIWYVSNYNRIKRADVKINESISGIDVALTKRYDVLTKMIEVVKGYSKHEKETLFEIIELRKNMNINELNKVNVSMNESFDKINVIVEDYPELKANENYMMLQKAIVDVEEHLQAARRIYNASVLKYNQLILSFPTNIIAKNMGMSEKEFFEANEKEKENVDVKIDK